MSSNDINSTPSLENIRTPPRDFAEHWYTVDEIYNATTRYYSLTERVDVANRYCNIPRDTKSREFAEWLTEELRRAMAKGLEIGRRQCTPYEGDAT